MRFIRCLAGVAFGVIALAGFSAPNATPRFYTSEAALMQAIEASREAEWLVPDGTYCDKSCGNLKCCP